MTGSGGAPLLVGDGAAAPAWRERCPGCRQQRRVQATDRIPYAAFLYIWISCLCAGTNSIVSMRHRHKLKNNVDRPWESDSQSQINSERFLFSKNTQEGFASSRQTIQSVTFRKVDRDNSF